MLFRSRAINCMSGQGHAGGTSASRHLSPPRIIPLASRVETMSDEVVKEYKEGITGSHLAVRGMERMITPLQCSSVIIPVLRLSIAVFHILSSLMWSWILDPSMNFVQLSASCAWDRLMSVLFPHLLWMESQVSLEDPVVFTPRAATSVQLRVIWPLASWSRKDHSSGVGVVEYIGALVAVVVVVVVVVSVIVGEAGFGIFPSI